MKNKEKPTGDVKALGSVEAEMFELNIPLSGEFVRDPAGFVKKFLKSHGKAANRVFLTPEYENLARQTIKAGTKMRAQRMLRCIWIHIKSGPATSLWMVIDCE